jgi:hypothetical protein
MNTLQSRVRPNKALHRIAAWLRLGVNPNGHVWAARGERWALDGAGEQRG